MFDGSGADSLRKPLSGKSPTNKAHSWANPDERDKCLLQMIFLQKNKKIICKVLNSGPEKDKRNEKVTFISNKAKVALVASGGDKTLAELAQQFEVPPIQITNWTRQLSIQAAVVFDGSTTALPDDSSVVTGIARYAKEEGWAEVVDCRDARQLAMVLKKLITNEGE
jgi:transposase-like protein